MTRDGETIVDLWAGKADPATDRGWEADTLNVLFSSTKGMVATAFLVLEDRGGIDLDVPACELWPALARISETLTIRDFLNHRAGLVGFSSPVTVEDFATGEVRIALESEDPAWPPGEDQGYHGISFGGYAAELFERAAGKSVGTYLREEIAGPLGADVYMPLPEELEPMVARLIPTKRRTFLGVALPQVLVPGSHEGRTFRDFLRGGDTRRAFQHPKELGAFGIGNYDSRKVRSLELPWASAVGSARGLARIYAPLANQGQVDGIRICSPEAIEKVMPRQTWSDRDRVLQKPIGFSQGFVKEGETLFSPNPESFGHPGAGGALGWADPKARISIGYVMNKMDWRIPEPAGVGAVPRPVHLRLTR